ncbi:MAG: HAMP domain-containing histidine kinase [Bacteroidales bacterium]|nr:HAMP domain-containing histidine kinase [Bacteroidales bacterium]
MSSDFRARRWLFSLLLLILTEILPAAAADKKTSTNELEIDNTCYALYQETERQLGKEGFGPASDLLRQAAIEKKDDKAQVLYRVQVLRNILARPASENNDDLVEEAREAVKQIAREKKLLRYYYQAYQLSQEYYTKHGESYRALLLLQEMQQHAASDNDAYGLWISSKYLADIYTRHNDYISAKPHIRRAIRLYDTSSDAAIRRESPTRLYCDLADTYPIASDSVRINVMLGWENAKTHMDSLRCRYYRLRLAALDNNQEEYLRLRDLCAEDPDFPRITTDAELFFSLIDATQDGSIIRREDEIYELSTVREMKVIANLCENRGYQEFAFAVEKKLVNLMETLISDTNQSRVSELDVTMGKAALNAELVSKERTIARISHILSILLGIILLVTAVLSILHIKQLEKANKKVLLANAAKTRFVQNMSHEVRTPLNAIVGFSQLLSLPDGSLSPEEKDEFSGYIVNNTKMLTMLLDDILNASAMDKGEYNISFEEGEKNFMCEAAISSAEHRLQPGVRMYYDPEDPAPFTFRTDPRRVQQILINLLTNSCKHTAEGEIRLSSSLSENPGYVTFSVTDTGTGVPPEQAEKIFERFAKLDEFVQGTGLGLSICRDIASRMGARVELDITHPGPGARFVFIVPINPEGE